MTQEEIQKLLDTASGFYNDGHYDDAIALWRQVLAAEPGNLRAQEGIKMADLLTSDWAQPASLPEPAPDRAAGPEESIDDQLALARHYAMLGETAEAIEACRRVLAADPDNPAAQEILTSVGAPSGAAAVPPASPTRVPGTPTAIQLGAAGSAEPAAGEAAREPLALELEPGLEEEIPWDEPPAARKAPEGGTEGRIAALLEEGDRLAEEGRFQEAIDAWSRIFILQDVHPGAEDRMDRARRALEQQERRMEEHFFRGEDLAAQGRLADGLEELQRVLEIRPHHAEARRRIAEIEAQMAAGGEAPAAPRPVPAPPLASARLPEEPGPMPLPTPPPAPPATPRPPTAPRKAPPSPGRRAVVVVVAGALTLAVASYFGWRAFFPPAPAPPSEPEPDASRQEAPAAASAAAPAPATAPPAAPIALQEVPPAAAREPEPADLAPADAQKRSEAALRAGIARFREGNVEEARGRFDEALRLDPANFEATEWAGKAQAEIDKRERFATEIAAVRAAFKDRDYRNALYKLYRVDPPSAAERKQVDGWIVACWYDWGIQELQGGRLEDAEKYFREVTSARPDDREAARHLEVLRRYRGRPADAALQAYAGKLTPRPLS